MITEIPRQRLPIVQAIDWMIENDVDVINFSLTGPHNPILEEAIMRARANGTLLVAAIGNDGPGSDPLFPAAYDGVIGVTAVTARHQIYRLAGRGNHVEFAAPGVLVRHAQSAGGYTASSGTSLAAPFVTSVMAAEVANGERDAERLVDEMHKSAVDLGETGYDQIFGFGLIQPRKVDAE